jgi:predicted RNA-binding protein associated with RNAse of E/G family
MATISADRMNKQILKDVMQRVETWPDADQAELLEYALEIEARRGGTFEPTSEELRDVDEALAAVRRGEIASTEDVEAVFAKYRGT